MLALDLTNQLTFALLLLPLGIVLVIALAFGLLIWRHSRRDCKRSKPGATSDSPADLDDNGEWREVSFAGRHRWCAIRASSVKAVQAALGLHNPRPCSWEDGMSRLSEHTLLISPPIDGWILVVGHGLPDPTDDVDNCFRLLLNLSRDLGQVQFFCVHRAVNHHTWVRAEDGRIQRAYAWAGETLWNQGRATPAEVRLGLKCFAYGETTEDRDGYPNDILQANTDKVHLLAANWSLDPLAVEDRLLSAGQGVVGDLVHLRYG
ncbi:MAG: hypothetical protein HY735_12945 [Verrucomicrobia bacterium]|nr:hypothetical protein [Verrucomicrobiota bacterium]